MSMARYITDFADEAVMLPIAVLIGVVMLAVGWRRGAIAWTAVTVGMLTVMLLLKLVVGTCGPVWYGDDLQSPSGHTAAAASIYGGALTLLLRRTIRHVPVGFVCAGVIALLVGVTRVVLGAHSLIEVTIGAVVGVTAAMILERTAGPVPRHIPVFPAAVAVCAAILVFHGLHLPAERAIRRVRLAWLPFGICSVADANRGGALVAFRS